MSATRFCAHVWRCVWLAALMAVGAAAATPAAPGDVHVLQAGQADFEIRSDIATLLETGASAGITAITDGARGTFVTQPASTIQPLNERRTLWILLRLHREANAPAQWTLHIPLPHLDQVVLYQSDDQGGWQRQEAGDTVAVNQWSHPGLYADFDLQLPAGKTRDVYLQIRNYKASGIPLRLASAEARQAQRSLEYVVIGVMVGTLLMLLGSCLIHYAVTRDKAHGWYAAYTALIVVVISGTAGLAGQWMWPDSPIWANYSYMVLPVLGVGVTVLFVRHVCGLRNRFPILERCLAWFGWACIPLAFLSFVTERAAAADLHGVYIALGPLLALSAAFVTWRRGNPIGQWLLMAYLPQSLAVLYLAAQMYSLVPTLWEARYAMLAGVAFSVPLLLQALNMRTRERREVEDRANALPTQDALTGLLNKEQFMVQVQAALTRALEDKEPAAIVLVEVVNHEHLRKAFGDAQAEQCLLRAVVKLHRVLRDVDPAGRVDTARFGLVLEGLSSRHTINERMVRLIASGLIPLPGLKPEVTLHFHVTCVLLNEMIPDARTILDKLGELMGEMSPRTRRPIRFLEPEMTVPAALQANSEYGADTPGFGLLGP
jgi:GGDEF domain-containing protein